MVHLSVNSRVESHLDPGVGRALKYPLEVEVVAVPRVIGVLDDDGPVGGDVDQGGVEGGGGGRAGRKGNRRGHGHPVQLEAGADILKLTHLYCVTVLYIKKLQIKFKCCF